MSAGTFAAHSEPSDRQPARERDREFELAAALSRLNRARLKSQGRDPDAILTGEQPHPDAANRECECCTNRAVYLVPLFGFCCAECRDLSFDERLRLSRDKEKSQNSAVNHG